MKTILILGAGKSATTLIDYLIDRAGQFKWIVKVADRDKKIAIEKIEGRPHAEALELDITQALALGKAIQSADFVISLLPPVLHILVAKDCIRFKKNLVTASYVSEEIMALDQPARDAGIVLMNELGADPGIDHMSAMEIIEKINLKGGVVTSFKSYCGGLIAPESDNNPWHYKIAWNPWNIVRAGCGGGHYLDHGKEIYIDYSQLYLQYNLVDVPGYGTLAAYVNRDSLSYKTQYHLEEATTVLRATFRHPDFVKAWHVLVQLGLTSDGVKLDVRNKSYNEWLMEVLNNTEGLSFKQQIHMCDSEPLVTQMIDYLELDSDEKIGLDGDVPAARVLQKRIEEKLKLSETDKDLLVFHHAFEYEMDGKIHSVESTLLAKGENQIDTAMARCVGLPMAIFAKIFLTEGFEHLTGVQIPINKSVYEPILGELKQFGIRFNNRPSDF